MSDESHPSEDEFPVPELLGQQRWTRRAQRIASVLWPSFGTAVLSTLIFFTFVDPELLGVALMPEQEISALTGLGVCFFFFWFIALTSSSTTMFLRRTRRHRGNQNSDA